MRNKLKMNKNHFSIEEMKIAYVKSRVSETTIKHIASRIRDTITNSFCYDPSYAPMLVAMLVAMLMTIAGRSPLGYRVVPRPTLFRVSLCSPESYR